MKRIIVCGSILFSIYTCSMGCLPIQSTLKIQNNISSPVTMTYRNPVFGVGRISSRTIVIPQNEARDILLTTDALTISIANYDNRRIHVPQDANKICVNNDEQVIVISAQSCGEEVRLGKMRLKK